jgi:hypothetical protein
MQQEHQGLLLKMNKKFSKIEDFSNTKNSDEEFIRNYSYLLLNLQSNTSISHSENFSSTDPNSPFHQKSLSSKRKSESSNSKSLFITETFHIVDSSRSQKTNFSIARSVHNSAFQDVSEPNSNFLTH